MAYQSYIENMKQKHLEEVSAAFDRRFKDYLGAEKLENPALDTVCIFKNNTFQFPRFRSSQLRYVYSSKY